MQRHKAVELAVGLFIIAGLLGLLVLAFKVSGLTTTGSRSYYTLTANFDNIGDLKVRAPVTVAGVTVGRVAAVQLNPKTFRAKVTLQIFKKSEAFPIDTSASILTQGILGSNYISLTPGFEEKTLKPGGTIETTQSALILEHLIGQLLFNLKGKNNKKD